MLEANEETLKLEKPVDEEEVEEADPADEEEDSGFPLRFWFWIPKNNDFTVVFPSF